MCLFFLAFILSVVHLCTTITSSCLCIFVFGSIDLLREGKKYIKRFLKVYIYIYIYIFNNFCLEVWKCSCSDFFVFIFKLEKMQLWKQNMNYSGTFGDVFSHGSVHKTETVSFTTLWKISTSYFYLIFIAFFCPWFLFLISSFLFPSFLFFFSLSSFLSFFLSTFYTSFFLSFFFFITSLPFFLSFFQYMYIYIFIHIYACSF